MILPNAHHRYCVRHMYDNFKKLFKPLAWKAKVWAIAYIEEDWIVDVQDLYKSSPDAVKWLLDIRADAWCRCYFKDASLCNLVVNNISETFNNFCIEARDRPVITCLEMLRRQLMIRFERQKVIGNKWKTKFCPKILKKVKKLTKEGRLLQAYYAGDGQFEVRDKNGTYTLNTRTRSCDCKAWNMSGIPCVHACAAFLKENKHPEDYIHSIYSKESFLKAYSGMICPIPDSRFWIRTPYTPLLPPLHKAQPGRPPKKRRRASDEVGGSSSLSRKGQVQTCTNCQEIGHNLRSCKNPRKPKQKHTSVLPRGRPKKQSDSSTNDDHEGFADFMHSYGLDVRGVRRQQSQASQQANEHTSMPYVAAT